jgi:hypothetical protein
MTGRAEVEALNREAIGLILMKVAIFTLSNCKFLLNSDPHLVRLLKEEENVKSMEKPAPKSDTCRKINPPSSVNIRLADAMRARQVPCRTPAFYHVEINATAKRRAAPTSFLAAKSGRTSVSIQPQYEALQPLCATANNSRNHHLRSFCSFAILFERYLRVERKEKWKGWIQWSLNRPLLRL